MHTEYLIVNYSCDSKKIKNLGEGAPNIQRTILFNALIVKAINLSDQSGFMVTS